MRAPYLLASAIWAVRASRPESLGLRLECLPPGHPGGRRIGGARPLLVKYLSQNPADGRALLTWAMWRTPATIRTRLPPTIARPLLRPEAVRSPPGAGAPAGPPGQIRRGPGADSAGDLIDPEPPSPIAQAEAYRTLAKLDRTTDPTAARDALVEALKLSPETPADLLLTAQIAEANSDTESHRQRISG